MAYESAGVDTRLSSVEVGIKTRVGHKGKVSMSFPLFFYSAVPIRVIDGDTVVLRIDRGFHEYFEVSCRLSGINAPELSVPAGPVSKDWLVNRVMDKKLFIRSDKLDKYGRPLVTIYEPEPATIDFSLSVNQELMDKGLAVKYGSV